MRRKFGNLSFVTLILVAVLAFSLPLWAAEVIILHTNDVHSRLESHIPRDAEFEQGGTVRLATLVEEIRAQYGQDKIILLDGGDAIHGMNVDNLFGGLPSIEVMNAMGYDAFTLGNHEFNYGQEILLERIEDAAFPILAANVTTKTGSLFGGYSAVIQEVGGIRVAVMGLVTENTPIVTHPKNVEGLVFHDPIEVAKPLAKKLRPEVDLLIALTHIGYKQDIELALAVPELDVIVGGHSHTELQTATNAGGVLIVQAHEYANNLGFLRLVVEDRKVVKHECKLIPVTHAVAKDAKVENIIDGWKELMQKRLGQVVGYSPVSWNGEREYVRVQETNLGNLVADVMRATVGADIALTNGGGIRASINPGDVSVEDIYSVLPFDNTLAVIKVQGMDIIDALEHSVRLLPEQNGGFLQVSGLTFEVIPEAVVGARVINVKVNGTPISPAGFYHVATNDFLAAGGDGYDVLKNGTMIADTGVMLRDVMVDYFMVREEVLAPAGNRIMIIE